MPSTEVTLSMPLGNLAETLNDNASSVNAIKTDAFLSIRFLSIKIGIYSTPNAPIYKLEIRLQLQNRPEVMGHVFIEILTK